MTQPVPEISPGHAAMAKKLHPSEIRGEGAKRPSTGISEGGRVGGGSVCVSGTDSDSDSDAGRSVQRELGGQGVDVGLDGLHLG